MKKTDLKILHIIIPICLLLIFMSFTFRGQREIQILIAIIGVLSYLVVSMLHHKLDKSLTFKTILEYILVASLVIIVMLALNLR